MLPGAQRPGNGWLVVIEVRDDGRGIPVGQQQQIFDEFVQLQSAGPRRPPGMGLGLSVVRRLGQLLEHPITLSSVPGGGTRFRLCVKRDQPQDACAPSVVSSPSQTYDLTGKRVLLIDDDDASVREATAQLLGAWHYQILTAADRSRALKLAEGQAIDILVVD